MSRYKTENLPETLAKIPDAAFEGPALLEFVPDGCREWSFGEVRDQADRFGAGLREKTRDSEDNHGGPVILFAPPGGDSIVALLGILRAGLVPVPIDTQMPDDDLRGVLENCNATVAITTQRLGRRLSSLDDAPDLECFALDEGDEVPFWNDAFEEGEIGSPRPGGEDDTALIFYTSGTTGPPKGVPLTHRNILFQLETVVRSELLEEDDRILLPLPLHHVYPLVIGTLAPLGLGLPVILPESLTGSGLTRAMREGEATVAIGVPRLYHAFYEGILGRAEAVPAGRAAIEAVIALSRSAGRFGFSPGHHLFRKLRKKAAPKLRLLASGGSPLDETLGRNLEALGWPVAIGYGLTETAPLLTLKQPGAGSFHSVGRAVEGVELRTDPGALDEEEREESQRGSSGGQPRGELLARGPNVFECYHGRKESGDDFTEDGFFRTGDIARIDEDGFVYIEGRVSTRIALQGGENVDPAKLEEIYGETEGVGEIGILEDDGRLAALVVPGDELLRDRDTEAAAGQIRDALEKRGRDLASYQRIARVEISTRPLERTRLGKLRRHALREAYGEAGQSGDEEKERKNRPVPIEELSSEDRVLLQDERARALWDLLCERYDDRPVSPDAHVEIDLGIDSMEWVELSVRIEDATGAAVDETLITGVERVRDLLEAIAEASEAEDRDDGEPLEDPESSLDAAARRWAKPRGPVREVIGAILFFPIWLFVRIGFRVEIEGAESLPDEPYILTPNHGSYLDGPCLGVALGYRRARRFFWAGWTDFLFSNFFTRAISRLAQLVPLDPRRGPLSSLAIVALALDRECPLTWFPEGRRSPDGSLREFKPGIGKLLQHRDVTVVPVLIEGAHEALPPGKFLPHFRKVRVRLGDPCRVGDLEDEAGSSEPAEVAKALKKRVSALADHSRENQNG